LRRFEDKTMNRFFSSFGAALLVAVFLAASVSAQAATPADFYRGRTVTLVIGYSPGGGYDLYARLLAQHLGRHIPGNPTVIPQSMPGAGSLKAANYLYSVAAKDGAFIGTFARGMGTAPLLGQARFDARKFTWLGSITKDVSVCLSWSASPIRNWHDVMARQFTAGGDGADSDPDIFAKLYKNVFGAKIRLATGFPGTADITLAMQRGEVQGLCGISWSTIKSHYGDWVKARKINILLQAAPQKDPDLPNVPLADEFARTPEEHRILAFVEASQIMARPFAAPPGIPADRREALRAAFDMTMKDPAFLADARKMQLDVNPVTGADIDRLVATLYATPKDTVAKAARAIAN
jgi:tripartite-type tricarboxylate transporter receptor subunit TctC